jgi:hypothetical protein
MDIKEIKIIERKVKYPRLELKTGLPVLIMPRNANLDPVIIVNRHKKWLRRKMEFIENIKNKYKNHKIYKRSDDNLNDIIKKFVDEFIDIVKVEPEKIHFRYMKTKWGSCSRRKRVCFNLALKHLPASLIRYVVFHEMMHLIIPNHSKSFWLYIKTRFRKPQKYEEMLYGYWFLVNSSKNSKNSLRAF